ncbi:hypothetical protein Hanom_Chr14g01329811 [Helianthus anomalus]
MESFFPTLNCNVADCCYSFASSFASYNNPETRMEDSKKLTDAIEATASSHDNKAYFDLIITVQSCYYHKRHTCQQYHPGHASLRLEKMECFVPTLNRNVADPYYSFASYNDPETHMEDSKKLTGNIL